MPCGYRTDVDYKWILTLIFLGVVKRAMHSHGRERNLPPARRLDLQEEDTLTLRHAWCVLGARQIHLLMISREKFTLVFFFLVLPKNRM